MHSLVEALQQELGAGGYSLVIATSEYQLDQEVTQAQLLLEPGAEGVVLVGGSHDPRLHPLLDTFGVAYTHTYIPGGSTAPLRRRQPCRRRPHCRLPGRPRPSAGRHDCRHHRRQRPGRRTVGGAAGRA